MGEVVGRSRIRRAADSYCMKESVSLFRTLPASAIFAGAGGLSGSLRKSVLSL